MFLNRYRLIHGIDIGNYAIKLVSISQKKGKIKLEEANYIRMVPGSFSEGMIQNTEGIRNFIDKLLVNSNKGLLSCSVGNEFIVIRSLEIPYMEREAVIETLRWEFADHLPFSSKTAVVDYIIRKKTKEKMLITAVMVPEKIVENYSAVLDNYNLKTLNVQPAALLSLFKLKKIDKTILIIDIGHYSTKIIVGNSSNIYFVRNLKIGAGELVNNKKKSKQYDFTKKISVVNEKDYTDNYLNSNRNELFMKELNEEVKRALRFYNRNNRDGPIENIYLTGGGAYINKMKDKLKKENKINVKKLDPFSEIDWSQEKLKKKYNPAGINTEYSIAFGLCLSEVYSREN